MKFDIKRVFLHEITLNDTFSKDMELDGTLPDYAPDITRLIRIDAKIKKPEVPINSNKAEMNCTVDFGILYESDYNPGLAYVVIPGSFSQSLTVPTSWKLTDASVNCAYLTCKLGPRKL